jgi:hypothetical protein
LDFWFENKPSGNPALGRFFENYRSSPILLAPIFHGKVYLNTNTKIMLGHILGDFFSQAHLVTLIPAHFFQGSRARDTFLCIIIDCSRSLGKKPFGRFHFLSAAKTINLQPIFWHVSSRRRKFFFHPVSR